MKRLIAAGCLVVQLTSVASAGVCDQLSEVRVIPFKDEKVEDAAYDAIVETGKAAIPCLVANLVNTIPMRDPRKAPPRATFVVGDLASMILCDITGRRFEDQLPIELRPSFVDRGVSVYFEYVEDPANRAALQRDWLAWLKTRR